MPLAPRLYASRRKPVSPSLSLVIGILGDRFPQAAEHDRIAAAEAVCEAMETLRDAEDALLAAHFTRQG